MLRDPAGVRPHVPVFAAHAPVSWHGLLVDVAGVVEAGGVPTQAFTCSPPVLPVQASSPIQAPAGGAGGAASTTEGRSRAARPRVSSKAIRARDRPPCGLLPLGLGRRGGNGQHPSTSRGQAIDGQGRRAVLDPLLWSPELIARYSSRRISFQNQEGLLASPDPPGASAIMGLFFITHWYRLRLLFCSWSPILAVVIHF